MSKEIYNYENRVDSGSVDLTPEEAAAVSADFVDTESRLMSVEELDQEALSRMKKLQEVHVDPSATTNDIIRATNSFMEAARKKYEVELNGGRDPQLQHELENFYRGHEHHPGNKDKLHEAALVEAARAGVDIKTPNAE